MVGSDSANLNCQTEALGIYLVCRDRFGAPQVDDKATQWFGMINWATVGEGHSTQNYVCPV